MNKHNASFCQSPRLFQPPRLLTLEIFVKLIVYCTLPIIILTEICQPPRLFRRPRLFEVRE